MNTDKHRYSIATETIGVHLCSSVAIEKIQDEIADCRRCARLVEWRERRDAARTSASLERLSDAARGSDNLLPPIRAACEAGATVGEIADTLRAEFGTYRDPAGIGG